MPHIETRPYVITARSPEGIVQQTRMMTASAVVLAMTLREEGYTDVEVTDPMGNVLCHRSFRDGILSRVAGRGTTR